MTEFLYQLDSYAVDFDAQIEVIVEGGVALDRTAFYPGGGGQPCDTGALSCGTDTWRVESVGRVEGQVVHFLDREPPPKGIVCGSIDWAHRYQLMRTHTAMHILCGVIWRDYQAFVTGGQMEPLQGRMDFEFERMQRELVDIIEQRINEEVAAAREVRVRILSRAEAFEIPDLIRTKINLLPAGISGVRIVEIEGLDIQADGGTHVANTAEVGPLRIVDYRSKGRLNKRLVVALSETG